MKTSELKPLANNPRKITDQAIQRLQDSIKRDPEYMVARPLIVGQDNVILGGNQRWRAIKALGMDEIPEEWVRRVDWDEEKARRFVLVDNAPTGMAGDWDVDLLKAEWLDVDLEGLGLEMDIELEPEPGLTDPDEVPEEPEKPITQPGDLWLLGEHRILCGDSTKAEDVERVLDGVKPLLMVTDPPYGIKRDKGFGGAVGFKGKGKVIKRRTYKDDWDSERPTKNTFKALTGHAKNAIIFGGNFFADSLPVSTHWIVWDKKNTMPSFGDCELAWTNLNRKSVKKYEIEYNGLIGKEQERFHPTQKPVKLLAAIIADYTQEQGAVFDPYTGSGTTIIACEQLKRKCRAIEISPAYVDVAVRRWENFTGKQAERIPARDLK